MNFFLFFFFFSLDQDDFSNSIWFLYYYYYYYYFTSPHDVKSTSCWKIVKIKWYKQITTVSLIGFTRHILKNPSLMIPALIVKNGWFWAEWCPKRRRQRHDSDYLLHTINQPKLISITRRNKGRIKTGETESLKQDISTIKRVVGGGDIFQIAHVTHYSSWSLNNEVDCRNRKDKEFIITSEGKKK